MAKKKSTTTKARPSVKDALAGVARKLDESTLTRAGQIVLRLSGTGGGDYCLDCGAGKTKVSKMAAGFGAAPPLIEIEGAASVVHAILEGKKDARKQFLAGGLRVRGDLRYFSDLAVELGIIDTPL